jgi:hypothetical protein
MHGYVNLVMGTDFIYLRHLPFCLGASLMGQDRFIAWKDKANRPTMAEIKQVAENFLGGIGKVEIPENDDCRLFILLPGTNTNALRGIKDVPDFINIPADDKTLPKKRWIEVFHDPAEDKDPLTTDIITRMQDEFTGCIATQLQAILARWWGGTLDPFGR